MQKNARRIGILDGFRALAILGVLFYHYFTRWTPPNNKYSVYPYNGAYDFFIYGRLGVSFFFIISGFVIFMTLENSKNFTTFWKKRFIRLFPSMVFASITTFVIFSFCDKSNIFPDSHFVKNIFTSISFIKPSILGEIINSPNLNYISGSYWSLWPEIQFYLFSSIIYFSNKVKFVKHFIISSFGLILINYIFQNIQGNNPLHIKLPDNIIYIYTIGFKQWFDIGIHIHFFTVGVFFYLLFKNWNDKISTPLFLKVCLALLISYIIYSGIYLSVRIVYILMFLLFFGFIYFPKKLHIMENNALTSIGKSSYFLYLIHENLGVLIIYSFGSYFLPYGFILTILVMVLFIQLSKIYTTKVEIRFNNFLMQKKILLEPNPYKIK